MSTEPETKKETKTEQDPKVASMLKALGYLDDPSEQAKLPAEREAEETEVKEETEAVETKTEGDATVATEEGKTDEAVATEEKKDETVVEEKKVEAKVDDKSVKKVAARPTEKKAPTIDEIADAFKGALAESKKEPEVEKVEEKKDDSFRKSLHPEELKALELAESAQKLLGDKYKDAADRTVDWIRRHREAATENAKRNGGKFDPKDEDYQDFVRSNRPIIAQHDREEIFMRQAEERATVRVRNELKKDIEQRDRAIAELKYTPVIEKIGEAVKNEVLAAAGEEFAKAFNDSPNTLVEDFPLEAPIISAAVAEAVVLSQEYLMLAKQIKDYDKTNPTHKAIISFIDNQGKELDSLNSQGKPFVRDGKAVISRNKFYDLVDKGRDTSRFTTLDDNDVVKMISYASKASAEDRLKNERKRVDAIRVSSEKRAAQKTTTPTDDKKEVKVEVKTAANTPKGGATISKGAKATGGPSKTIPPHMKALGYDLVDAAKE